MFKRGKLSLLACNSGKGIGQRIRNELNRLYQEEYQDETGEFTFNLVDSEEVYFANGEIKTVINDNIRGTDMYIIQNIDDPLSNNSVNDNLMALFTAIDSATQSDVEHVTVVLPQFPYSRQERRKGREGITAKVIAHFIDTFYVKRVITMDIHAEAIGGFFTEGKLENLHASRYFFHYVNSVLKIPDLTVVAPDVGSAERARFFSKNLRTDLAIIDKARNYAVASQVESMRLVGDVSGKNVLLCDDMISTGGTIINACRMLKDSGAKKVFICITHAFFNGKAVANFDKAYEEKLFDEIIGTDTVFWGDEFIHSHPWYHEISVAELFARVIFNINRKESVSALLK